MDSIRQAVACWRLCLQDDGTACKRSSVYMWPLQSTRIATTLTGICVGAIAGFATITPAAGYVQPWGAFEGRKEV